VDIYPFRFTRERLKGIAMEFGSWIRRSRGQEARRFNAIEQGEQHDDRSSFRTESEGSGAALPKARRLVACGSGGSAIALMAARAGIGQFT